MIPAGTHRLGIGPRIPRESGDDPVDYAEPAEPVVYSPRERG